MLNSLLTWVGIIGLAVGPYSLGVLLEQKQQPTTRDLGSRIPRRY